MFNQRSISLHEFCMNDAIEEEDLRNGIFSIRYIPSAKLVERGLLRLLNVNSIPSVLMISDSGKYQVICNCYLRESVEFDDASLQPIPTQSV